MPKNCYGYVSIRFKVSEIPFYLEIKKYYFYLHKAMEKPYLNLHFKFHDFFPWNNEEDFKFRVSFLSKPKPV